MMGGLNQLMEEVIWSFNKANLMLVIINRGVSYKSAEVISELYRSYVDFI